MSNHYYKFWESTKFSWERHGILMEQKIGLVERKRNIQVWTHLHGVTNSSQSILISTPCPVSIKENNFCKTWCNIVRQISGFLTLRTYLRAIPLFTSHKRTLAAVSDLVPSRTRPNPPLITSPLCWKNKQCFQFPLHYPFLPIVKHSYSATQIIFLYIILTRKTIYDQWRY